jgi:BlaI family transcriptional regulator, penicillinase repressor
MEAMNQNELEALRILWDQGECKPAQIQERFSWPIDNGTLRSALVNLVEKGHVKRALQGKAFFYTATIPKTTVLKRMTQMLMRIFAGGSSEALVMQLVETGDIKPSDLSAIHKSAGLPKRIKKGKK